MARLLASKLRIATICFTLGAGPLLSGCGPLAEARQSMQSGNSLAALSSYQQALAKRPHDATIRQELQVAQTDAASDLAAESSARAASGDYQTAIQLAERAARLDPQYGSLAEASRRALAREYLDTAEVHLTAGRITEARESARAARAATEELSEPEALLARIDEAEARKVKTKILVLLNAGEFDQAHRLAVRCASLQPGDHAYATLASDVDQRRREAQFDKLFVKTDAMLADGQLEHAASLLEQMNALAVRRERLTGIRQAYQQRVDDFDELLATAREQREANRLKAAVKSYDQAIAIASDRPDVVNEHNAVVTRADAESLRIEGANALDHGEEERAIHLLQQSQSALPDARTRSLLDTANAAWHRRSMDAALDADDYSRAIDHGIELRTLEPSDELNMMLSHLRDRLVDEALRHASQLHATGATVQAKSALKDAMQHVSSEALDQMHEDLRADELIQRAVQEEQQGRYDRARSLYLSALAAGGDRGAIEARIDDTDALAAMQFEMEAAQHDAATIGREASAMRRDIDERDRAIRELERVADALSYDLRHLKRTNSVLDRKVYDFKREVDRLCAEIRHLQRDRDHWRRKYQQAARQPRRRPPHDH